MFKNILKSALIALCFVIISCNAKAQQKKDEAVDFPVKKTDAEWKQMLDPMAFYVLRQEGTEPAFTGKFNKHYEAGTYLCGACNAPLYQSEYKYDSGSGWPSFDRAISDAIHYDIDFKLGHKRVELECANCGSHLGHIFNDGPKETTGKRHCINSVALNFKSLKK